MSTVELLAEKTAALTDDPLFEIIDGVEVEVPPMSALAVWLANQLSYFLNAYAIPQDLGIANVENLFHLGLPVDRNRRPDVAFVTRQRWPKGRLLPFEQNAWDIVPNITVEVVSPSDLSQELLDRIDEYFRAGVELMWVIYPKHRRVYVYESPLSIRVLTDMDTLDGGKVLPQFRLPLQELFVG